MSIEAPVWVEEFFQATYFPRDLDRSLFPPGFVYFDGLMKVDLDRERHGYFIFKSHAPALRKKLLPKRLEPHHAAYNNGSGVGMFARCKIYEGEVIGEYGGLVQRKNHNLNLDKLLETIVLDIATRHDRNDTTYQLETRNLYIDSKLWGNEMRFINHFEGIGKKNVDFWSRVDDDGSEYCKMAAICDIEEGDELLMDYGEGYTKSHKIGKHSTLAQLLTATKSLLDLEGNIEDSMELEFSDDGSMSSQN